MRVDLNSVFSRENQSEDERIAERRKGSAAISGILADRGCFGVGKTLEGLRVGGGDLQWGQRGFRLLERRSAV